MSGGGGDPTLDVARDLRAIVDLHGSLLTQAVHSANDPLMPGGRAMVALGQAASPEAWEWRYEAAEHLGRDVSYVCDEDDSWEPPLQTLLFWSEAWRTEHGQPFEPRPGLARPTAATEAVFLAQVLRWAWEIEPRWQDFADDVEQARQRMEALLRAGEQTERGVPCLYETCRGKRLTRDLVRDGRRWVHTDWRCPACGRTWDEDAYSRMVWQGAELAKVERIGDDTWCTVQHAARMVGRSVKTIRTWVEAGYVTTACVVKGRRRGFVRLADVEERHGQAGRRRRTTAA